MNCIVAVDKNWGIGYRGKMLYSLPKDLKFFREKTLGKAIVVGRSTLHTFPQGKPLSGRDNIVLTSYPGLKLEGGEETTLERLPLVLQPYNELGIDIYVVGGGMVYRTLLPYCKEAIVTHVQDKAPQVDAFFPNLTLEEGWTLTGQSSPITEGNLTYFYGYYKNQHPKELILKD